MICTGYAAIVIFYPLQLVMDPVKRIHTTANRCVFWKPIKKCLGPLTCSRYNTRTRTCTRMHIIKGYKIPRLRLLANNKRRLRFDCRSGPRVLYTYLHSPTRVQSINMNICYILCMYTRAYT